MYTNHSVRVSACTLLGELGFSDLDVQAVSKHKSVDSLGIYKRTKEARKLEMASSLAKSIGIAGDVTSTSDENASMAYQFQKSITSLDEHEQIIDESTLPGVSSSSLYDINVADFMRLCEGQDIQQIVGPMVYQSPNPIVSETRPTVYQSGNSTIIKHKESSDATSKTIIIRDCANFTINM